MAKLPDDNPLPRRTDPFEPPGRPGSLGRLAHYEVEAFLGRGGFGTVVRAFDDKLHRQVAIKLLSSNFGPESSAYARFLREARAAANVRHENVVQIYAVEETPVPYIVLEYIPGESLQERLDREGKLPVADVLAIGAQVARGLAAAHGCGLVHRDIKPCNILVETVGGETRAKIADFGLALSKADARLTQSGMVAGTPMYMAPEQASAALIDSRADLFSLGSVLYAMLSGQAPFGDSNLSMVLGRIVGTEARPIRQVAPHVPLSVCRVVTKLHAKKPEDRYQTGTEVAEALTKCLNEPPEEPAARPFGRAGRKRLLLFAALATALVAGALVLALELSKGSGSRPKVEVPAPPTVPEKPVEVPTFKGTLAELFLSPDYTWSEPKNQGPGINTAMREASPALSADERTIIFSRMDLQSSVRKDTLYWSRRASKDDDFPPAKLVFESLDGEIDTPSLTGDGLEFVFAKKLPPKMFPVIFISKWNPLSERFDPPKPLAATVNAPEFSGAPILSQDGLKLIATSSRAGGVGGGDFVLFARPNRNSEFGSGRILPRPVSTTNYESADWLSPDESVFVCTNMPPSPDKNGIPSKLHKTYFHVLDAAKKEFGPPRPFTPIPNKLVGRPWFSPDGMTMYFHSRDMTGGKGDLDIWESHRVRK